MTDSSHFDYIIIGNGLAGLQLALKFSSDSYFKHKRIALIDPSRKKSNDKTWSFWEAKKSQWDDIVYKSWENASVITSSKRIDLELKPYSYKTIRAIDFYSFAIEKLKSLDNFYFIIENVKTIIENEKAVVNTENAEYTAKHIFDSRVPEEFSNTSNNYISIIQHFKGWIIKTKSDIFDDNNIIMMDYRLKDGEQTTFMYVLPFSKTEALVEFTYFNDNVVDETIYDDFIKQYIKQHLKISDYSIVETEMGQIPMTTFPFQKFNTKKITKIGTGGGWVKGSTGYSFKHTEKKVVQIISNLKQNKIPSSNLYNKKYQFYDKVFLKVLKDENQKGEWIFKQFYNKNSVQTMFRFLDEESSFFEEVKIMWSLFSWSFIKAFFKTL